MVPNYRLVASIFILNIATSLYARKQAQPTNDNEAKKGEEESFTPTVPTGADFTVHFDKLAKQNGFSNVENEQIKAAVTDTENDNTEVDQDDRIWIISDDNIDEILSDPNIKADETNNYELVNPEEDINNKPAKLTDTRKKDEKVNKKQRKIKGDSTNSINIASTLEPEENIKNQNLINSKSDAVNEQESEVTITFFDNNRENSNDNALLKSDNVSGDKLILRKLLNLLLNNYMTGTTKNITPGEVTAILNPSNQQEVEDGSAATINDLNDAHLITSTSNNSDRLYRHPKNIIATQINQDNEITDDANDTPSQTNTVIDVPQTRRSGSKIIETSIIENKNRDTNDDSLPRNLLTVINTGSIEDMQAIIPLEGHNLIFNDRTINPGIHFVTANTTNQEYMESIADIVTTLSFEKKADLKILGKKAKKRIVQTLIKSIEEGMILIINTGSINGLSINLPGSDIDTSQTPERITTEKLELETTSQKLEDKNTTEKINVEITTEKWDNISTTKNIDNNTISEKSNNITTTENPDNNTISTQTDNKTYTDKIENKITKEKSDIEITTNKFLNNITTETLNNKITTEKSIEDTTSVKSDSKITTIESDNKITTESNNNITITTAISNFEITTDNITVPSINPDTQIATSDQSLNGEITSANPNFGIKYTNPRTKKPDDNNWSENTIIREGKFTTELLNHDNTTKKSEETINVMSNNKSSIPHTQISNCRPENDNTSKRPNDLTTEQSNPEIACRNLKSEIGYNTSNTESVTSNPDNGIIITEHKITSNILNNELSTKHLIPENSSKKYIEGINNTPNNSGVNSLRHINQILPGNATINEISDNHINEKTIETLNKEVDSEKSLSNINIAETNAPGIPGNRKKRNVESNFPMLGLLEHANEGDRNLMSYLHLLVDFAEDSEKENINKSPNREFYEEEELESLINTKF